MNDDIRDIWARTLTAEQGSPSSIRRRPDLGHLSGHDAARRSSNVVMEFGQPRPGRSALDQRRAAQGKPKKRLRLNSIGALDRRGPMEGPAPTVAKSAGGVVKYDNRGRVLGVKLAGLDEAEAAAWMTLRGKMQAVAAE